MSEQLIRDFWAAMGTNDFARAAALLHPEFESYMPQTREHLRGREAFAALNAAYPTEGIWRFSVRSVLADGDRAVSDVAVTDGTQHARAVTFHHVRDRLILRQVEYWPDPYPAPAWRRAWVEVVDAPPF